MFKKSATGLVVLTYLSGEVKAIKNRYRPIDGTVPWHKGITDPTWTTPDWPVDYVVPTYGNDPDMSNVKRSLKGAEKELKKTLTASWAETDPKKDNYAENPRNYFVPDFGADHDIIATQAHIEQSEKTLGKTMHANFGQKTGDNRGYFVPDFGVDREVLDTQNAISVTEKNMKKKFSADFGAKDAPVNPRNYFVPDFGTDHDIIATQAHIKQSEKALTHEWKPTKSGGFWDMPSAASAKAYNSSLLQTEAEVESDPINSSAGLTQYLHPEAKAGHPMDYKVANFGQDHEVKDSISNEKIASKLVGHKWDWKENKARDIVQYETRPLDVDIQSSLKNLKSQEGIHGIWELPPSNVQIESDISVQDDPICSSAGCTQFKHPEVPTHPMDYFVPHFGKDIDIKGAQDDIKAAEKIVGKKWDWKKKPDGPPRGYFVPDFGVDEDIKNVGEAIASEESNLGHKWAPTQDANGFWNVPEAADNSSYGYNTGQYINNSGLVQVDAETETVKKSKSDPIFSSAGNTQYKHPKAAAEPPRDYFVPNFGQDKDVKETLASEKVASAMTKRNWVFPTGDERWKNEAKATDYNFQPKLDSDVVNTQSSIANAESSLGAWNVPKSLAQVKSDPICSSAGCTQFKHPEVESHPMDYFVPNFGQDQDIKNTLADEKIASKVVGKHWKFPTGDDRWKNPARDVDYNFAPELDSQIKDSLANTKYAESELGPLKIAGLAQRKSDPICSSVGCPKTKAQQEAVAKVIQYPVDVPLDSDIRHSISNEQLATDQVGHTWKM